MLCKSWISKSLTKDRKSKKKEIELKKWTKKFLDKQNMNFKQNSKRLNN